METRANTVYRGFREEVQIFNTLCEKVLHY